VDNSARIAGKVFGLVIMIGISVAFWAAIIWWVKEVF
jgi:hypothetical protein